MYIHHITINYDPGLSKISDQHEGHKFYFTRDFYIDYHPDNEFKIFTWDNLKLNKAIFNVCNKPYDMRKPICYVVFSSPLFDSNSKKFAKYDNPIPRAIRYQYYKEYRLNIFEMKDIVLLNGTPSSGRSKLVKATKIKTISMDEYLTSKCKGFDINPNEYSRFSLNNSCFEKAVNEKSFKVITVSLATPSPLHRCVLLYRPFIEMCKGVAERVKYDIITRDKFLNYIDIYYCSKTEKNSLEKISKDTIVKGLELVKYLFANEIDLALTASDIFNYLGMKDNTPYYVHPKIKYDHIILNNNGIDDDMVKNFIQFVK